MIGIIMGSTSDLDVMRGAAETLDQFEQSYELTIVSAHRTPERLYRYAQTAEDRGLSIIIAGAGGAAHLPGMVAALTTLPVIGVPVFTEALRGLDSLLSIVQMPRGVPVATVAINNSRNAALLALRILALNNADVHQRYVDFIRQETHAVLEQAKRLESGDGVGRNTTV